MNFGRGLRIVITAAGSAAEPLAEGKLVTLRVRSRHKRRLLADYLEVETAVLVDCGYTLEP
jgi:hypothetical protein